MNALGISWLSCLGHEETLGRTGIKKEATIYLQGLLTLQAPQALHGGSRKFSQSNTTDAPVLSPICRLACHKAKLHLSLATACHPILRSILLSGEAIQHSQGNPLAELVETVI